MVFYREKFEVQSEGLHPTFHNITEQVAEIVKKSAGGNYIADSVMAG